VILSGVASRLWLLPKAGIVAALRRIRLKGLPLIWSEHPAQTEQHAAVGFFEFSPGLGHAIDLGENLPLIRLVGRQQGFHRSFLFVNSGTEIHQAGAALLKYSFHSLLLVRGKTELLRPLWIVPPAAMRSHMKGAVHGRPAAFHGGRAVGRPVLGRWADGLRNRRAGCASNPQQARQGKPSCRATLADASCLGQCACSLAPR
jgi:hypothetical protein